MRRLAFGEKFAPLSTGARRAAKGATSPKLFVAGGLWEAADELLFDVADGVLETEQWATLIRIQ